MAQARTTLKDFIRLHGTIDCAVDTNDVFRKLFRKDISTYFTGGGNLLTLKKDLRKVTAGLTPSEARKLAGIFQHEAERL